MAGGAGAALFLAGCALPRLPLYSRLFGLVGFFDSVSWWRLVGAGLRLGGPAVFLSLLSLEGRTPRFFPGRTSGEGP